MSFQLGFLVRDTLDARVLALGQQHVTCVVMASKARPRARRQGSRSFAVATLKDDVDLETYEILDAVTLATQVEAPH